MKQANKKQVDMINGSLLDKIVLFSLPLAASSILQQLFNSVDVAVVGHFASSEAQAAVGCVGPLVNLLLNLFLGISVGTNVLIAGYIGQKDEKRQSQAVHTALVVALISGLFLVVLGQIVSRPVLQLMNTPANVLDDAVVYLRIYFLGMPFIMVYNFGAAILRSKGDTRRPLYCLVTSGIINAGMNLVLVIVFHLGVAGVAIATSFSNVVSSFMVASFLFNEEEPLRLHLSRLTIHPTVLKKMLQIGVPAGLQSAVFSVSNIFIQTALNGYGSDAVAGSAVSLNFEYYTYFILAAFGQAAVTFTGQNYGAGKPERCKKVFRICLFVGSGCNFLLSLVFLLGRYTFVGLFTTDPVVAEYAACRMVYTLALNFTAGLMEMCAAALRGMGHSMTPAVLTIFGTCVLRIVWLFTACKMNPAFEMLLVIYPITWIITGVVMYFAYLRIRSVVTIDSEPTIE